MEKSNNEGIIGWFVRNPVAANLLMFAIIGLGLYSGINLRKQTTPDFDINYVSVRAVSYTHLTLPTSIQV